MRTIKLKKGLDIPLEGKADSKQCQPLAPSGEVFGISPEDYLGYLWKSAVKEGDTVAAGTPLLRAKENPDICLVSPVDGVVTGIIRGERRRILYVTVKAAEKQSPAKINIEDLNNTDNLRKALQTTGFWAMMRQRPYDIVPEFDSNPRDIFVTGFDSNPLAPELLTDDLKKFLEAGLKALATLTKGKVYLGLNPDSDIPESKAAETIIFDGPHPAGNVGVQICAVKPVNKGETVWTLDATTVARIGKLMTTGECDYTCRVAITGPAALNPSYVNTYFGAKIESVVKNHLNPSIPTKIISGNALTGTGVSENDYLHFPYRQITLIKSGEHADEFMGWASLSPKKFSVKRTFPSFLKGLKGKYNFDDRILGGHRAMILSGELEKVFPFDILPEYLLKAIITKDIDRMEKLGIYEVAPEDFALPEFVDTSKGALQQTVREGLDYLRNELG